METVLVVGSTGNIGVSAVQGALSAGRRVLAIVRNDASAKKLIDAVGSAEGITTVQADITSDTAVKGVVDQVKAGKLPAFQHVYSCAGGEFTLVALKDITTEQLRRNMQSSFETNFFAYRDTIGYLLDQGHPNSTWTLCTGAQGDSAQVPLPALTQGPLFTMAKAASRETSGTNVRFVEVYLAFRVEVDAAVVPGSGVVPSSKFASVYAAILDNPAIKGARVLLQKPKDIEVLRYESKI